MIIVGCKQQLGTLDARYRRKDNNGVRLDVMDQDPRTESVSNRDDFFESTTQSRKLR